MSETDQHSELVAAAEKAIKYAQEVRAFHRKRTKVGSSQRNTDLRHATKQVKDAMKPIRSALGRAPYSPDNEATRKRLAELREVSQRLQTERRKLWKLRYGGKR